MVLTWSTDGERKRTCSEAGHVITGIRVASTGRCFYNAWTGEPHQSKHLEQGWDADGLARCKSACEQHWQKRSTNAATAAGE